MDQRYMQVLASNGIFPRYENRIGLEKTQAVSGLTSPSLPSESVCLLFSLFPLVFSFLSWNDFCPRTFSLIFKCSGPHQARLLSHCASMVSKQGNNSTNSPRRSRRQLVAEKLLLLCWTFPQHRSRLRQRELHSARRYKNHKYPWKKKKAGDEARSCVKISEWTLRFPQWCCLTKDHSCSELLFKLHPQCA